MPARDGSGPKGQGARTGRGMGNCQTDAPQTRFNIKRVWWNPFNWFGGSGRYRTLIGRGIRQGTGRGRR